MESKIVFLVAQLDDMMLNITAFLRCEKALVTGEFLLRLDELFWKSPAFEVIHKNSFTARLTKHGT